MKFELYTDGALTCDLPAHRLRRGDIVKLVDHIWLLTVQKGTRSRSSTLSAVRSS